jgi:hypothetical protein
MYDPQTTTLIRNAPPLPGLDIENLPQLLTEAYTEIVSIRSSIRSNQEQAAETMADSIDRLRRLASTYESYVSLLPQHPSKAAAAYVSATAHQLIHFSEFISARDSKTKSYISQEAISSDIASMLLFLIAGYPSDATELARDITGENNSGAASILVSSLSDLARGRLQAILQKPFPELSSLDSMPWEEVSTEALWIRLIKGVRALSIRLLGQSIEENLLTVDPIAEFLTVQQLAVEQLTLARGQESTVKKEAVYSIFAGPHHLASLLIQAGKDLLTRTVTAIPSPPSLDKEAWHRYVTDLAERRPYLWPNHLKAISEGYLDPELSAAVSFPTGAGKSTLAELRIAVTLLRGQKALFLVPTHALVSQVTQDLRASFPKAAIRNSVISDNFYSEVERTELPDVAIMTPERCLTLIGINIEAFESLDLLVFDECHLIHPKSRDDRRSLDSTLCLLNLFAAAPKMKILMMSAMMSNTRDIADWLTAATGRQCLSLELDWKPTRQVRGCLVFPSTEIEKLREQLRQERARTSLKARQSIPPKRIQSSLNAVPFGFFCLHQTWQNTEANDYRLLRVLDHPVRLGANKFWLLTPNKNHVATELAANFSRLGMKTLIFAQNLSHAIAIARETAKMIDDCTSTDYTEQESELLDVAIQEAGGAEHVFSPFNKTTACHHGLLLPAERRLSESIFARRDGINVLAATPTLAQGMNLPAQVVIIVGDDRFDPSSDRPLQLEAHEILNAAGRAGRAGYNAQGMVLVIPGAVIDFDSKSNSIQNRWFDLQERIFSKSDQCLTIEDPIDALLDFIQVHGVASDATSTYFLHRLPVGSDESSTEKFLNQSLAAFYARKAGADAIFTEKIRKIAFIRQNQSLQDPDNLWQIQLASKSGVPPELINTLDHDLANDDIIGNETVTEWTSWFLDWIKRRSEFSPYFISMVEMKKLFSLGTNGDNDLAKLFLSSVSLWLHGASLREIEISMGTPASSAGYCMNARKLTIRNLPLLSYGLGLVAQVYRARIDQADSSRLMPLALATAAACVRNGFDAPEKLAIQFKLTPSPSRMGCHRVYDSIAERIAHGVSTETFLQTQIRVNQALSTLGL